jgi:hypothetical protein
MVSIVDLYTVLGDPLLEPVNINGMISFKLRPSNVVTDLADTIVRV